MKNHSVSKKQHPSSRLMYSYSASTVPTAVSVATSITTTGIVNNSNNKSSSLRRAATPSRRRRIIYETARRLTRQYINDALFTIHCASVASECIQYQWRNHRSKVRHQNAVLQIQGLLQIYQAKQEANKRRHYQRASKVITSFFRSCHLFHLSQRAATIKIQKHWRGLVARNDYQEHKLSLLEMECSAIVIQSCVRSYIAKVAYEKRCFPPNALIVQKWFRVYLAQKRRREMEMKEKRKKLMVDSSCKVQHWWKRIMTVKRLIEYAMEETIRLRLAAAAKAAEDKDRDETMSIDLDSQDEFGSNLSCVSVNDDNGDNLVELQPPFQNGHENDDENDPSHLIDDNDLKSNTTSCDLNDDISLNDNSNSNDDEASTSTLQSSMSDESNQRHRREVMESLLAEMKQYQAVCRIQHHVKIYIHRLQYLREQQLEQEQQRLEQLKQQQEAERQRQQQIEQERLQKISIAAMVLTRKLWMSYESFSKRREQMKREMEMQAATLIQTYIRSFLATRYVQNYREAYYDHILKIYHSEFFYGRKTCYLTTSCDDDDDYSNNAGIDKFLENVKYNEEEEDKENLQYPKQQKQQDDQSTSQSTSFHDEWVGMLPPESKKLIPPGCNLNGIDLDDENSLIRCLKMEVRDWKPEDNQDN